MNYEYTTNRLIIKKVQPLAAGEVLRFYEDNKAHFEPYELDRPAAFYTLSYQARTLQYENTESDAGRFHRFYIFLKEDPNTIIGTVSFSNIVLGAFKRATLGYKFDYRFLHQGYATEAVKGCIYIMQNTYKIHRIEAYIRQDNDASLRLINRVGFISEGIAHDYVFVNGSYIDMLRFAYTGTSIYQ